MPGNYQVIRRNIALSALASGTLYVYMSGLSEFNLCISSTVDLQVTMYDGFGNASDLVTGGVPNILNVAPNDVTFSTGGRSYISKPKDSGVTTTTYHIDLVKCGPWLKVVIGNTEAVAGVIQILGEI